MGGQIGVAAAALLLAWPAMRLAAALGERTPLRMATTGLALAPALWLYLCLGLTPLRAVRRAPLVALAAALAIAATLHWWRSRDRDRNGPGHGLNRHVAAFLATAVFLWAVAVRLWPQGFTPAWPLGWDSSFHLALVRAMELGQGVPFRWLPFETTPVNYPVGMHAFLFVTASVSGVEPPLVFNVLVTVVAPVFSGLAVARLAGAVFADPRIAWSAAAAYLWLADHGGLDTVRWGGLPWQWAASACVVLLARLLESRGEISWRDAAVLAAIALTHHHAMLSTLAFVCCWLLLRSLAERGFSRASRSLLRYAALGLLLAAPQTVPMLSRLVQIGESRVLAVDDPFPGLLDAPVTMPGMALVALALPGVAILLRGDRLAAGIVVTYAASMLLAFVACHYVSRLAGSIFLDGPRDVFTPTRFLGNLAFVAALPAGASLLALWQRGGFVRRASPLVALALACVPVMLVRGQYKPPLPAGMAEAYEWIRARTPADSVIVSDEADKKWVAYLAAREVDEVPRPVSELVTPRIRGKRRLAKLLRAGPLSPDRFEEPGEPALLSRPLYFVREARIERPYLRLVYASERRFVYLYQPS